LPLVFQNDEFESQFLDFLLLVGQRLRFWKTVIALKLELLNPTLHGRYANFQVATALVMQNPLI